ncbi:MAG TPA: ABC transporter substrate-binding protein [Acidimicrobiales bacterium]|nr:ABC transporter substrate-binding protein [Acidimicrobiales bacterium]
MTNLTDGFLRRLAVVAVLVLLAGACGGDDDGEGATDTNGGDTGNGEELPDLSGVQLEVALVPTGTEAELFGAVFEAFEQQTGASVTVTSTGDDIAAVIGPRIAGGDPPDVALLPQPGLLRDFAGQGALQPLEDVVGEAVDEHYAQIWRELGSVDGELYGVWFKAANKSLIWYNTTVFDDAGIEPPEDLEGFLEVAQTATDFGVPALSIGGGDGWPLTDWFENVYLRTAGPETYDQLAAHEIPWTDPSVVTALETMAETFTPTVLAGGTQGTLSTDFNTSVTRVFTEPPDAAMVFEGDFVGAVITGDTETELGEGADVFPFPEIEDSGPAVVSGGDVAVLLDDTEGGRALIEYLASPEAGEVRAELGGFISPNRDVDIDAYPDEISRTIAESLIDAGENLRFDLSDLQPSSFGSTQGQGMWKLFQDFVADTSNVAGITEQLEAAANVAYGG